MLEGFVPFETLEGATLEVAVVLGAFVDLPGTVDLFVGFQVTLKYAGVSALRKRALEWSLIHMTMANVNREMGQRRTSHIAEMAFVAVYMKSYVSLEESRSGKRAKAVQTRVFHS